MKKYLNLLKYILENGEARDDRTGVGTIGIFGYEFRHHMNDGFPLLTTKKIPLRWVFEELKWFLSGSTDVRDLQAKGVDIWDEWATKEKCAKFNRRAGDLGPVYGALWRSYPTGSICTSKGDLYNNVFVLEGNNIDQIDQLIDTLRVNPNSRRHIVTGWHPYWATQVELPPCHTLFQCHISTTKKLNLRLYARSIDSFLGLPFNIASYGMLLLMLCKVCSLDAGELTITFGDLHIYKNHLTQVNEQLLRQPKALPSVLIEGDFDNINDIEWSHIKIANYDPYLNIKADVAV